MNLNDNQLPEGAIRVKTGGYLIPNKPGHAVAGGGRPKGRRSLSTIVRDLGEQELDWDTFDADHTDVDKLKKRFRNRTGFEAISIVAQQQALAGDNQAREWLRRAGYGDKMDITSNEETITPTVSVSKEMIGDFTQYLLDKTKQATVVEGEIVDTTTRKDDLEATS